MMSDIAMSNQIPATKRSSSHARTATGYTLVEVVGSMVVSIVIIAVCLPVISRLFQGKAAVTREVAWEGSIEQLGEALRKDSRIATEARIQNDGEQDSLTLTIADGSTITYQLVDGEVRRTRVAEGETAREGYSITDDAMAEWSIQGGDEGDQRLAILRLKIPASLVKQAGTREFELVAAIAGVNR